MKNKSLPVLFFILFYSLVCGLSLAEQPNNTSQKISPTITSTFFPKGEACKDQEKDMLACNSGIYTNRAWSCSLKYCLTFEEMRILKTYQKECDQTPNNTSQCIEDSFNNFFAFVKHQNSLGKKCIGKPEKIKLCNQKGLHWNCQVGICVPTRVSLLLMPQKLYQRCQEKLECIDIVNRVIKKYVCTDEYKDEDCIPSDSDLKGIEKCAMEEAKDLKYFAPKHDFCIAQRDVETYINKLKSCVATKSYSTRSPLEKGEHQTFDTIESCLDSMTEKGNSYLKGKQQINQINQRNERGQRSQ